MTCGARVTARDVLRMSMRQNLSISYVIQKANGVKVNRIFVTLLYLSILVILGKVEMITLTNELLRYLMSK